MAQWNKNTQDYLNQERTLHEVFMCADRYGNIGNCGVTSGPGGGIVDAFGRSRISEPFTLADYSHQYGLSEEILPKLAGAGSTVEHLTNKASASLVVGIGSTDYAIHQTRMYHHYMPGKSQFALSSFNFQDVRENTVKRTGYFDDRNGVFVQQELLQNTQRRGFKRTQVLSGFTPLLTAACSGCSRYYDCAAKAF